MIRTGRKYHLNLDLSFLNGQCYCNSQTLPIIGCRGDVIIHLFWRQTPGADLRGSGKHGTNFPHQYTLDVRFLSRWGQI